MKGLYWSPIVWVYTDGNRIGKKQKTPEKSNQPFLKLKHKDTIFQLEDMNGECFFANGAGSITVPFCLGEQGLQ